MNQQITKQHWLGFAFVLSVIATLCMPTETVVAQNKKGFSKTYNGVKSVPSRGPAKHGHVGAQTNRHRSSSNVGSNGINQHQHGGRSNRSNFGNGYSNRSNYGNVHQGHQHRPNRTYGNVYTGGLVNRYGSGIGFSSSFGTGLNNFGSTYRYGGLSTGYYQPNYSGYTQPYGLDTYGNRTITLRDPRLYNPSSLAGSINANELELLRLRVELQRARQRELEFQGRMDPNQIQRPNSQPISAADQAAINRLNEATIIDVGDAANSTQLRAERAFRVGLYGQAAKFAELANVLNGGDGRLDLFAAQAYFADDKFDEATQALNAATQKLDADKWSYFVDNFRLFYGQNDYVNQTKSLSIHIDRNPEDLDALIFRGYQYGALGYPDAANRDFDQVLKQSPGHELATKLKQRFGQARIQKPQQ